MEHVVGMEGRENAFHTIAIGDRGDDGRRLYLGVIVGHHQSDVVLWRFGLVYQHELCRTEKAYLPNHLAANATCRSCNKYLLALQKVAHALHVDLYLVAG